MRKTMINMFKLKKKNSVGLLAVMLPQCRSHADSLVTILLVLC